MAPIAKVATRVRMGDPDPDAGFWLTRSPAERVAHLRELQALYYGPHTASRGDNLQEFVARCLGHDVRFLVVGGHAVAAYGHPRLTKNLDMWIRVDPENTERMAAVLDESGFGSAGLTGKGFAAGGPGVQLGRPPNRIDIWASIAGVDFESCWERRDVYPMGSLTVPLIGLQDLERNKLAAGRHQDLADVEALRRGRAAHQARPRDDRDGHGLHPLTVP